MDVGDDDLFAVFDSESSKAKQVVIPDPEDEEPAKVKKNDSESLIQEICGARPKRQASETDEDVGSKKLKTDVDTTLMTGLSDLEVMAKIKEDERQVQGESNEMEQENIEEDETVVSLVEAAPR